MLQHLRTLESMRPGDPRYSLRPVPSAANSKMLLRQRSSRQKPEEELDDDDEEFDDNESSFAYKCCSAILRGFRVFFGSWTALIILLVVGIDLVVASTKN
eukprot:Lankesteria_metandrocarpae@DN10378_c0_g1_i1.p2